MNSCMKHETPRVMPLLGQPLRRMLSFRSRGGRMDGIEMEHEVETDIEVQVTELDILVVEETTDESWSITMSSQP